VTAAAAIISDVDVRVSEARVAAYPGPEGAHSATAAERLFGDARLVSLPTFGAVADAVASGSVDAGVLPIENTLTGSVNESHDLLYDSALSIQAEVVVPVRHCLMAPERVPLDELRMIWSHPVALDQCRHLLTRMPWVTAVAAPTTSEAAARVARDGDPTHAAIASERAAELHGLEILDPDVGDHPEARTRFVAVGTSTRLDGDRSAWRTAFFFVTDHRPGALHAALEPFAAHAIDLQQLVSRPIPDSAWRYRFDCVLSGHPLDPVVSETLREAYARTRRLRVFGSYPATPER
jgi:prephenate dehydratase